MFSAFKEVRIVSHRASTVVRLILIATVAAVSLLHVAIASELDDQTPIPATDFLLDANKASPYSNTISDAVVQVVVHVLQESDGTGGLSVGKLNAMLDRMCADFKKVGVTPIVTDVINLDNSVYYSDPIANATAIFLSDRSSNAVDLFLGPEGAQLTGLAESIPGTALVLADSTATGAALSHLFGHCLGLYNTEEIAITGADYPGSPNPGVLGDLVADTPADPGLAGWINAQCALDSGFESSNPGYAPDLENLMSSTRLECMGAFSSGQAARVFAAIENAPELQQVLADKTGPYDDYSVDTKIRDTAIFPTFVEDPQNAAAFDVNGDGFKDMLVCGFADVVPDANRTVACVSSGNYSSHGVPEFVDRTSTVFPGDSAPMNGVTGLIVADYNNDGRLDFYAPSPNYSGPFMEPHRHQLFLAQSDGSFDDVTAAVGLVFSNSDDENVSGSWGDYDGDGFVDLLVLRAISGNTASTDPLSFELHLYRNMWASAGSPGHFDDVTSAAGLAENTQRVLSALWADFDQDHDLDLVLMQSTQNIYQYGPGVHSKYYANNGNGTFTDVTSARLPDHAAHWNNSKGYAVAADLDNDGDLDVAYHHVMEVGWFSNDLNDGGVEGGGSGTLAFRWRQLRAGGDYWRTSPRDLETYDFDLDGDADLVVANEAPMTGGTRQWLYDNLPNSDGFNTGAISGDNVDCAITLGICAADFNSDGNTDLYLGVPRSRNFFFRAVMAAGPVNNHWLGVTLAADSNSCNYRGLGATVIVYAPGHKQAQVVDGGSGRAGQHDLDLVFGLGSIAAVDSIRVIWPCGQDQVVYPTVVDQYVTIGLGIPHVDAALVTSSVEYNIGDEVQTWVFEWQTDYPSVEDRVIFPVPLTVPGKGVYSSLESGDPDVSTMSHALLTGPVKHRLEWHNVTCMGPIQVGYKVASRAGVHEYPSARKKIVVPYCIIAP